MASIILIAATFAVVSLQAAQEVALRLTHLHRDRFLQRVFRTPEEVRYKTAEDQENEKKIKTKS